MTLLIFHKKLTKRYVIGAECGQKSFGVKVVLRRNIVQKNVRKRLGLNINYDAKFSILLPRRRI